MSLTVKSHIHNTHLVYEKLHLSEPLNLLIRVK